MSKIKEEKELEKEKEIKYFECGDCGLHEEYHWYGKSVPFCRAIVFSEESYVTRDPFSLSANNNNSFLLLGSKCSLCSRMTCQQCSVFFTRRLCAQCFAATSYLLPQQLKSNKKNNKD